MDQIQKKTNFLTGEQQEEKGGTGKDQTGQVNYNTFQKNIILILE